MLYRMITRSMTLLTSDPD